MTALTLTRPDGRRTARLWATGVPLTVGAAWYSGARPTPGPAHVAPAHVLELVAAGWVPSGPVEPFLAAVAAGLRDDVSGPSSFLFVRTCDANMRAHGGFEWPRKGRVAAPDWRRDGHCGRGLHGFLWGWGDPNLADWSTDANWLVCRAGDHDDLDGKIKVPECKVVYCGTREGATQHLWDAGVRGVLVPASRVLATFAWQWWTALDAPARERLLLTLPTEIGPMDMSAEAERRRTMLIVNWQVRVSLPAWLDAAKLGEHAEALRALQEIVDWPGLDAAGTRIRAARDAARDAAWDAARDAAWDAARDAARDAAWDAASAVARGAAWDAARDAAWDAARDAARDAAWGAAWDALAPTVASLQNSARALLVRMSEVRSCVVDAEHGNSDSVARS